MLELMNLDEMKGYSHVTRSSYYVCNKGNSACNTLISTVGVTQECLEDVYDSVRLSMSTLPAYRLQVVL